MGGAELNVLSGVSLLGLRTGIISKIPSNDIGRYVRSKIRFNGVSDDYLIYDPDPGSRMGVYYYENGAYPRKPRVVYDRANSAFCSESTAKLTFQKTRSLEEIMRSFAKEYPVRIIASTQRTVHSPKVHDFGSVLYCAEEDRFYTEEPYRNIEVVDRIGSGDAYVGGILYGLLSEPRNYHRALQYGNAASSVKNTIPGDLPSSDKAELDSIIRDHNQTGEVSEMSR